MIGRRTTGRRSIACRGVALVAVLALAAGCGRGDGDESDAAPDVDAGVAQPADPGAPAPPVAPVEPAPTDTPTADAGGDVAQPDAGAEAANGGGHRAEALGIPLPDCTRILTSRTGMLLAFPDPDQPASLQAGSVPVRIEVVGCANTDGGPVLYEIYHGEDRTPTLEGAAVGDLTGGWAEFRLEETLWIPGSWRVVVQAPDIGEELEVTVRTS